MSEHRFETSLEATGPNRALVRLDEKPPLEVVPPPEFGGPAGIWTPEDLFVAAVETCLMMTFSHLARQRGLYVTSYRSRASGVLTKDASGMQFSSVEVYPEIHVEGGPERIEQARTLLELAEGKCLVSRSLKCEVRLFPYIGAAESVAAG